MKNLYLLSIVLVFFFSCKQAITEQEEVINVYDTIFQVIASAETTPVTSVLGEDAADDPSIWINKINPEKSLILGTDKKRGICVYDLDGIEKYFYPVGRVNNIDVRYNFDLNGTMIDLVGASNRTSNSIILMAVQSDSGSLIPINSRLLKSEVNEVYGFCLYYDREEKKHYAFINGKNGILEQWELFATPENLIDGKIVRKMFVGSQPEGMVADDELGNLFVGEEDKGVWRFSAKANADSTKQLLNESDSTNTNIVYDVEGISIYYASQGKGYLIVSSQGNNSYALFERSGNHRYLGSFTVVDNIVDGSQETDGLDVTNVSLGSNFPYGLFIAQDGYNYDDGNISTQNFKLVPWENIANAFKPKLLIDTLHYIY